MRRRWGVWVLIAALVAGVALLLWEPAPALMEWGERASPDWCAKCHAAIVEEWRGGWHAQAATDPEMGLMTLAKNFQQQDCNLCHAPSPVFLCMDQDRFKTPARRPPDDPQWPVGQGVDCLTCHHTPDGMASADPRFQGAGRPSEAEAPCRPVYRPELATADFCGACHNQHGTVDQWRATPYGTPGAPEYRTCQACHQPLGDGPATVGRPETHHASHGIVGGHDPALVRSAATLALRRDGDAVVVTIDTRPTAHNFPTDYRTRFGLLLVEALDGEGRVVRELFREKYRQPFRNELGGSDPAGNTQLRWQAAPHERRVDVQGHAGRVRARLTYSLRPYTDVENPHELTQDRIEGGAMFLVAERVLE